METFYDNAFFFFLLCLQTLQNCHAIKIEKLNFARI
jgi:hypothetical protein